MNNENQELSVQRRWINVQKRLAKLKKSEQELRPEAIKALANPNTGKPGHPRSETVNEDGYKFAVSFPQKTETHKDEAALQFFQTLPPNWLQKLAKVSYTFDKEGLEWLEQKAIMDENDEQGYRTLWQECQQHFTTKQGMPSLTLKAEPENKEANDSPNQ